MTPGRQSGLQPLISEMRRMSSPEKMGRYKEELSVKEQTLGSEASTFSPWVFHPTPPHPTKRLTKYRLSSSPFLPLFYISRQIRVEGHCGVLTTAHRALTPAWEPAETASAQRISHHSMPGARTPSSTSGWSLGPQSSLNVTDRQKGLGENCSAEQEGHGGPFLRAPNRAWFKNETSPCGEATRSLLIPLVPLCGQAVHLQASPRAHKPQHLPRGSPKHGEPSRFIPQTSKPSVGYTIESSGRTTWTSLASLLLSAPV